MSFQLTSASRLLPEASRRRRRPAFRHTPMSAARAIRGLCDYQIAKTWEQFFGIDAKLSAYTATKLVQEQCNGPLKNEPVDFRAASEAVAAVMPELFAEYWESLPCGAPAPATSCPADAALITGASLN